MVFLQPSWNGLPGNVQSDGWHLLRLHGKRVGIPMFWISGKQCWRDGKQEKSALDMARQYEYCYPIQGAEIFEYTPTRSWIV